MAKRLIRSSLHRAPRTLLDLLWEITRRILDMMAARGAPMAHLHILKAINANPGISRRDLNSLLYVSERTITHWLSDLRSKGMIRRCPTRISLTPIGHSYLAHCRILARQVLSNVFGDLTEAEQVELLRMLLKLQERVSQLEDHCREN